MTKHLEDVIALVRELPDEDQDEAAELLAMFVSRNAPPVQLDDETRRAVLEGLEQARAGNFVSEEAIADLFRRERA